MTDRLEFEYVVAQWYAPDDDPRPFVPVRLSYLDRSIEAWALVDSGADMNVMPYEIGTDLGLSWEGSAHEFELQGLVDRFPARAVAVDLEIESWPSLKMAFAWSTQNETPVILGQWNFFQTVDVCFLRSRWLINLELPFK
ncbi:MAG: hypothetical protein OXG85_09765 [Chloroflexi bacterium]|nr:hypothetical protein [Chloroflexota bacterium]